TELSAWVVRPPRRYWQRSSASASRTPVTSHSDRKHNMTSMSNPSDGTLTTGGPDLPQVRRLRTTLPGPRSRAVLARRDAAVPIGVATAVPTVAVAAGGGVIIDADDN